MCEYGFEVNEDFVVIVKNDENPLGGRPKADHAMKIDMAKEIANHHTTLKLLWRMTLRMRMVKS